jgi:hypothetical protein
MDTDQVAGGADLGGRWNHITGRGRYSRGRETDGVVYNDDPYSDSSDPENEPWESRGPWDTQRTGRTPKLDADMLDRLQRTIRQLQEQVRH